MTSEGTPEVDRDVRVDEAWKANLKRSYDEYQNESLRGIRLLDAQISDLHTIRVQMLSDLATNSNLAAKQSIDHRDNANVLADTATGAVADAMVNQSPPDEVNSPKK